MLDWLAARAQATPHRLAIVADDRQWSYATLNDLAAEYAAALHVLNISAGDTVAVLSRSSIDYVSMVHATARIGAVLLPLNTRLTLNELQDQLEKTRCRVLLHDDDERAEQLESIRHPVMSFTDTALLPTSQFIERFATGSIFLDDLAAIVFTSGTSGKPRGVMLSYGSFFYSAMSSAYHLGTMPEDRWLCVLPFYHVSGLSILYRACLYGITVDLHEKFDPERINEVLANHPISLVSVVPTMLHRLLDFKTSNWHPALRTVLIGGAAASPELLARCAEENIPVATTYGLTEAASQVATSAVNATPPAPENDADKFETESDAEKSAAVRGNFVGRPLMLTSVRIVDENHHTLPPGIPGEIVVRGPTVMQGYYDDPEATSQVIHNGELYTGDIGYLDAEGNLFVLQRRSDLILSGGENVYPAEVEAVLKEHPAIQDVCVVGVEDAEWGQRVAAAIVLKEATNSAPDEIIAFCRERLAGYKQPRLIKFVAALPLTASGKIERSAVRLLFHADSPPDT